MSKFLDVPYRSQWDADATRSTTDCGPACLAMVLDYYGVHLPIDELLNATGVRPGRYVGFGQMQRVARDYHVTFAYGANYKLNNLKRWVDEGKPAIALVKYSFWSQIEPRVSTQDDFIGPHFVVVVGYGEGNIYINDPNYWPPRREEGYRKAWSEVLFNLAWSNVRTATLANPNNSVIVPTVGRLEEIAPTPGPDSGVRVTEYTVSPGDSWTALAARFFDDRSRYPEILAFNNLRPGAVLQVGQTLRIPLETTEEEDSAHVVVLGAGAIQTVDADLVEALRTAWVNEEKVAASADVVDVLRAFVDPITQRPASGE
jgi:uncharacterized protein YvpB